MSKRLTRQEALAEAAKELRRFIKNELRISIRTFAIEEAEMSPSTLESILANADPDSGKAEVGRRKHINGPSPNTLYPLIKLALPINITLLLLQAADIKKERRLRQYSVEEINEIMARFIGESGAKADE